MHFDKPFDYLQQTQCQVQVLVG